MSTFKIEGAQLLDWLFPEWHWQELAHDTYDQIFQKFSGIQDLDDNVIEYLKDKKIKIGFHQQYKSGGGWTLLRNITLSPGDDPLSPYVLSLIVHEVCHLKQSLWMRLSMQGELRAWQFQQKTYREFTGHDIGEAGQAYPGTKAAWDKMANLDSNSREDLMKAQQFTREVSPDYRSECLPLFPLPQEFGFHWRQGKYKEAFQVIWNLVTCK